MCHENNILHPLGMATFKKICYLMVFQKNVREPNEVREGDSHEVKEGDQPEAREGDTLG